jgi:3-dehydroquinate synthetase
MAAEAMLAVRLGIAGDETPRRQNQLLDALGLPVRLTSLDADAIVTAIGHDKKARDGRVPFVLAPRIGEFKIVYDIAADDVRAVIAQLGD